MHQLKLVFAALVLISVILCEPSEIDKTPMPFFDARTPSCDEITAYDTLVDDYMFFYIKSTPILERIFSSLIIIPVASFLALALLHKSEFDARTTKARSAAPLFENPSLWVYSRPFFVAAVVLILQKGFLYSAILHPMTTSIKERIRIIDPLLIKPDQYLCYIMACFFAQSVFTSIKINSFASYILACSLWLFTRRVVRDLYLYLPRTGNSFMLILTLTGYTSYIYSNGGPSAFFKSNHGKKTNILSKFSPNSPSEFGDINESFYEAANVFEHSLNFLTHMANSGLVQIILFGILAWYFSSIYTSSSDAGSHTGPIILWKAICFFREDIKISLPFYIVKWTKLLPYSLTNTALPVVSTIGDSIFFLTIYLCIAVVTHADERLDEKKVDQYLPLGV